LFHGIICFLLNSEREASSCCLASQPNEVACKYRVPIAEYVNCFTNQNSICRDGCSVFRSSREVTVTPSERNRKPAQREQG